MFCSKLEYPDKTTDILPITDKYYSLKLDKLEQSQLKEHQLMSRRHMKDLKNLEQELLQNFER